MRDNILAEPLMSVEEAADFLGYAVGTVYNKAQRRELPHVRIGRRLHFRRSQLETWRAAQIVEVHPEPTVRPA